ncbi:MAG: hypothetical protein ACRENQ_14035 [Gemmatimonadaceae bacterium]
MARSTHRILPCLLALIAGCASTGGQQVYVAPTADTIISGYEQIESHPGQVMYVENRSSVPILVYSVALRDCENVKQQCEARPLNLHLDPGSRTVIARIEAADPTKAYNFSSSFAWRADSAPKAALGALASSGDTQAQRELGLIRQAEARRQHQVGAQDLDLTSNDVDSMADRAGSLRTEPDSLILRVGMRIPMDTVRLLLMSKTDEPLGRVRELQWRFPSEIVKFVAPDSIAAVTPGRTFLQLRLPDKVAPANPALHQLVLVPIIVQK